ncbi:MAG: DUF4474 domain-containing protein [Acutalibacteraceae bacterium]|nr:DUF4474 domain-containing protein [Acutalibacteraceae bacterium]
MKKRIIAFLLTLITVFSVAAAPAGATVQQEREKSRVGIVDLINIWDSGYAMPDVGDIIETMFTINSLLYQATGLPIFSDEVIVITVNDTIGGIIETLYEQTGVDFSKVYKNLPQSNKLAELVTESLELDIPATQEYLTQASRDSFAKGDMFSGAILRMIELWLGIIDEVHLTTKPYAEQPGCEELGFVVTYRDGRTEEVYTGILYDSVANQLVGKNGNPAFMGYYIDFNQNYVYTGIDVWQREMGFNIFYDIFCYLTPFFFHYTTQRVKFNYQGKDWMFQMWKGRYAIANGGELGIYTRPEEKEGSFYDCGADEDMLVMSVAVYHGDELLFKHGPMLHWWVTGFAINDTAYLPESLTLFATIEMRDEEMLEAASEAFETKKGIIDYEVEGLTISFVW